MRAAKRPELDDPAPSRVAMAPGEVFPSGRRDEHPACEHGISGSGNSARPFRYCDLGSVVLGWLLSSIFVLSLVASLARSM